MNFRKYRLHGKIIAFSRQVILNCLPTRLKLFKRNVIVDTHGIPCVFCGKEAELARHLFFNCSFSLVTCQVGILFIIGLDSLLFYCLVL